MTDRQPSETSAARVGPARVHRLTRGNINQAVADHVRKLVFGGVLKPHERVPQDEIAASLGVSRLPVREALFTLESEGLVYLEPRRGAFVSPLDRRDVLDHYEMFGLIHGMAASRAAGLVDDATVRRLEQVNIELDRSRDPVEQDELNWEFHRTINRIGGSRRLHVVLRTLARNIPRNFFDSVPHSKRTAVAAHRRITKALRARDGEGVAQACRDHLLEEGDLILRSMEQHGFWDGDGRAGSAGRG